MKEVDLAGIRPSTLRPADDEWEQPTPQEIQTIKTRLSMSGSDMARLLGFTVQTTGGSRQIRRWIGGEAPIPYSAWAILCYEAGFGPIWART